ncbi:MAG: SDR family oxidoreductase [Leptospiraceae bacterium]|nr:SDR family oxidoreductase [Leptospiraceae bacterium]
MVGHYKRIAIITGAGGGIGYETALFLARQGYRVWATMRRDSQQQALAEAAEKERLHLLLRTLLLDVRSPEQIEAARQAILEAEEAHFIGQEHPPLLCLINNAGYGVAGTVEELPIRAFREQMETNFFGALMMTKAFLPLMRETGQGRIVQISSGFGRVGAPMMSAYNASKFALEGFSEALRYEVLPHNVFVSLVEPGPVATGFNQNMDLEQPPDSPYAHLHKRAGLLARTGERIASSASDVARTVQKICEARYPSLRYEVGVAGYLAKLSNQFAPQDLVEGIYRFL